MKRYSLTLLLCLLIVGSISAYYVNGAADRLPQYRLTTVQGDPVEGSIISLDGSYGGRMRPEPVTVTTGRSVYNSEKSIYQTYVAEARNRDPEIADLIREYPGFMRGKGNYRDSFYQDEEWLVYVTADSDFEKQEIRFRTELMDRKTGNIDSFDSIPETDADPYIIIRDVQRVDDRLHILVLQGSVRVKSVSYDEVWIYVIDPVNGDLIRSEKLNHGVIPENGGTAQVWIESEERLGAPSEYAVLIVREENNTPVGDQGNGVEKFSEQLFLYSYKTGVLTLLPDAPKDETYNTDRRVYDLSGHQFFAKDRTDSEFVVSRYDLQAPETEATVVSITAKELGSDRLGSWRIADGRVYVLFHRENVPMAAVVNAIDGTVLYIGKVTFAGPEAEAQQGMEELNLRNLYIQK